MGSTSSKEKEQGLDHPSQFYEGCTAAQGGAYTISEIAFKQAIVQHPGHDFWTRLMEVAIAKAAKSQSPSGAPSTMGGATPPRRSMTPDDLPTVLQTSQELATTAFSDVKSATAGYCSVSDTRQTPPPAHGNVSLNDHMSAHSEEEEEEEEELDSRPTLVLPVDHRLVDVQDYVRMLTDIARIYRRKAADSTGDSREMSCRLSMLYNAYTSVRLETLLAVFQDHFASVNTEGDPRAEDRFQIYGQHAMSAQWGSAAFKSEMDHVGSVANDTEVNFGSRHASSKAETVHHSYNADLCVFWQTIEYLRNVNALSYALSSLRLMRVSDYTMSPATQKAVVGMSLRVFGVVEQELLRTVEANSNLYIGALMKKFITLLLQNKEECQTNIEITAAEFQRRGGATHAQRTVKELEPRYIRLGTPDFAMRQMAFRRTAMDFPVTTLPLVDMTKLVPVTLELQHNGNRHRLVKLMTPLDRNYSWYMSFAKKNNYERDLEKPGKSAFLLQKCGVQPEATLKDPTYFTCVGLQDLGISLLPLSLGTASILFTYGKVTRAEELGKVATQMAIEAYGGASPLSDSVEVMFSNLNGDITV